MGPLDLLAETPRTYRFDREDREALALRSAVLEVRLASLVAFAPDDATGLFAAELDEARALLSALRAETLAERAAS